MIAFRTLIHFFLLPRLFFFSSKSSCKSVNFDGHTIESEIGWINSSEIKSLLLFYAFEQPGVEKILIDQRSTIPSSLGQTRHPCENLTYHMFRIFDP